VLEVTRAVGGKQAPPDDEASPRELHALRQESEARFAALATEQHHLRERLRHAELAILSLRAWVMIGIPALGILVIILMILLLSRG